MSTHLIGQRFTQLRHELASPGEKPWSQTRVAEAAGLTRNIVLRLENAGAGTIGVLQALLIFYYERGFNPSWILLPDNSAVAKRLPEDGEKMIAVAEVAVRVQHFHQALQQRLDALEKDLLH